MTAAAALFAPAALPSVFADATAAALRADAAPPPVLAEAAAAAFRADAAPPPVLADATAAALLAPAALPTMLANAAAATAQSLHLLRSRPCSHFLYTTLTFVEQVRRRWERRFYDEGESLQNTI